MPVTVRGTAVVRWKPAFTLTLASPDGSAFPTGETHPLVATLTRTNNGAAVPGRTLRLITSPTGRVGDEVFRVTDATGKVRVPVSDDAAETVQYQAKLQPRNDVSSNTVSIAWSVGPPVCYTTIQDLGVAYYQVSEEDGYYYGSVTFQRTTGSTTVAGAFGRVTRFDGTTLTCPDIEAFIIFNFFGETQPPVWDFQCQTEVGDPSDPAWAAAIRAEMDAEIADLESQACS